MNTSSPAQNQPPVAILDIAELTEDAAHAVGGNVLSNDFDLDPGSVLRVAQPGIYWGRYGHLVISEDGAFEYILDIAAAQELGRFFGAVEEFSYTALDEAGAGSTTELLVIVNGANDGPVARYDEAVVEHGYASGNVLANDSDIDVADTLSVANAGTLVGNFGRLYMGDTGHFGYDVDENSDAFRSLAHGEEAGEFFVYVASDGVAQATSSLHVRVAGVNDRPVAVVDTAVVGAGVMQAQGNVLANDLDPDRGAVLQVAPQAAVMGIYGWLQLSQDGTYVYTLFDAGAGSLGRNDVAEDVFTYLVSDNLSPPVEGQLVVTVRGGNDAPFAQDDEVTADANGVAVGNVLANDYEVDSGDRIAVANAGTYTGAYGLLQIAANGSYTYVVNPDSAALRALGAGEVVADEFTYIASDGLAQVAAQLSVFVTGTNDAPVLQQPLQDQVARENRDMRFTLPAQIFADPDQGDALTYTAWLLDGDTLQALPAWLSFDGQTGTFSGRADAQQGGSYALRIVATDTAGESAVADMTLHVADQFRRADGSIVGSARADVLNGLAAAEVLSGGNGNDVLFGNDGDDSLFGGGGSDRLVGGAGDDTVTGGAGRDLVVLERGDGADTFLAERHGHDVLYFGGGIDYNEIDFARSGGDLVLTAINGDESLTLQDWYGSRRDSVDWMLVEAADGSVEVYDFDRFLAGVDARVHVTVDPALFLL